MKRLYFILCILLTFFSLSFAKEKPDFRFPKTVAKEAESDLKKSLLNNDGEGIVDALVRYGLAWSSISEENLDDVLSHIEKAAAKENRYDIRTLLLHLEARVIDACPNRWQHPELTQKRDSLLEASVRDIEALSQCPLANYPRIIDLGDKPDSPEAREGLRLIPTLAHFLLYHARQMGKDMTGLNQRYLQLLTAKEQADNAERQRVHDERQFVHAEFNSLFGSRDSIRVKLDYRNVHEVRLELLQVPDDMQDQTSLVRNKLKSVYQGDFTLNDIEQNKDHTQTIALPPHGYGKYMLMCSYENRAGERILPEYFYRSDNITITDVEEVGVVLSSREAGAREQTQTVTLHIDRHTGRPTNPDALDKYYQKRSYHPGNDTFQDTVYQLRALTDRGLYRPGETVKYTALLSGHTIDQHHPLQGRMVVATLLNTMRKELKRDTLWTDSFGQAVCGFELPVGERTGNFSIQLQAYNGLGQETRLAWGNETFAVSEYKAPTFSIDLGDTPARVSAADSAFTICGRVATFAGLPVKHTSVKVGILESWWYWSRNNGPDADEEFDYEATAMTDADGRFVLHVPMSEFYDDDDDKEDTMYLRAVATCTNVGGETQSEQCNLMLEGLDDDDDDDLGEHPALPLSALVTDPAQLVDSMIPAGKALWIHQLFHQQKADKEALVRIGTSVPDAYIYYIASDKQHGVLRHGWLHYAEPGLHDFTFAMPQPAPLGQQPYDVELQLSFLALREGELTTFDSYFTPLSNPEDIRLSLVTFRDRLLPAGTESWTFRVQGQRLNLMEQRSRLMLTLYDHSLDDLEPFTWSYYNESAYQRGSCFSYAYHGMNRTWGNTYIEPLRLLMPAWPNLNLYGECFFDVRSRSRGPVKIRGKATHSVDMGEIMLMDNEDALQEVVVVGYGAQAKSMATGAVANRLNGAVPGVAVQEEAGEVPAIDPAAAARSLAGVRMREGQQRLALWEPMLATDSTGTVSLTFTVPDQNTTWRLQALALAPWLTSARLDTTLLAQRPLMVQPSLPRFVRQGDRLSLSALVLNATLQEQQVTALVEAFDPRTRQTIAQQARRLTLDARGQQSVELWLQVPDTLAQLAFSIRALVDGGEAAGSGDGEQRMLPVLPAVSPVTETIPFYLNPGDSARVIELPDSLPTGADIQLEWCDNPVVYCLEALPSLMSECHPTSSSLIHRLFAYALSEQVVHRYPQSMADSLLTDLGKLQNADGGFSWIDYHDRYSSLSATAEVLELLGELHQLGAYTLPEPMTTRALAYYDKAMLQHYNSLDKKARKQLDINFYSHYLYLRSLFPEHSMKSDAKSLFTRAMSQSMERWGELELAGRAYVALALHRQSGKQSGKQQSASRHIVESLRQHALIHPHRGMYWDQLGYAGYRWLGRVTQTSLLLQAFAAIDPHTDELDQIRKWLLLEKQTSHWGNSSLAADAVYALLSSGSDWQSRTHIEGLRYDSVHDRLLLRDTLSLLRTLPSDTRRVEIPAASATHPSWGAVYMRYAAPTRTAQAASNEEILITKQLLTAHGQVLPLSATAPDGQPLSAAAESLHVGDRVTIRLTVKTTRDMSEVMITDERAACLEPVTQLPGYCWHQGVGYYLEPLDQRTHLFIPRLPRGEHLFTYDLYVTSPGHFALGLASVQCQYAPMFNAHTEGRTIAVE